MTNSNATCFDILLYNKEKDHCTHTYIMYFSTQ